VSRYSAAKNYSLVRTGTASITGTLKVGTQLTVDPSGLAYSTFNGAAVPDGLVYQWLRNGAAISGSDASDNNDYTLQSADYGQSISLRITAAKAGWVSNVYKTGSKTVSTKGTLVQVNNVVTTATGLTRTAQAAFRRCVAVGHQDDLPVVPQRRRYHRQDLEQLQADLGRLRQGHHGQGEVLPLELHHPDPQRAARRLGQVQRAGDARSAGDHIGGTSVPNVGGTLSVDDRTYNDMTDGSHDRRCRHGQDLSVVRSGTAISTADGGKDPTYTLKPVDKGKTITVKVTVSVPTLPHLLPSVATSKATKTIGTAMIPGWDDIDHAPATLDAASTAFTQILVAPTADEMGFDAPLTGLTLKYQWYRGDPIAGTETAIANKTTSKYTLTQSDSGLDVWVRVTISKAAVGSTTYTTVVKDSTHTNYTLTPSGSPDIYTLLGAPYEVGTEINVGVPSFFDSGSAQVLPISQQKQWYRNGVAISVAEGGTGNTYVLKAADAGKTVSVKVTSGKLGYLANIATFTATPTPLGTLVGPTTAPTVTVSDPATNTLLATPAGDLTGSAASGSPIAAFSYQWLRDGSVIANQTAATYNLKAADLDH
jgi:hypothetical protein